MEKNEKEENVDAQKSTGKKMKFFCVRTVAVFCYCEPNCGL